MKKLLTILLTALLLFAGTLVADTVEYPDPVKVTVMNRHGRQVAEYSFTRGDMPRVIFVMEGLQPGWYLMKVHSENHYRTYRIRIK